MSSKISLNDVTTWGPRDSKRGLCHKSPNRGGNVLRDVKVLDMFEKSSEGNRPRVWMHFANCQITYVALLSDFFDDQNGLHSLPVGAAVLPFRGLW